jgi:hypothetical protein
VSPIRAEVDFFEAYYFREKIKRKLLGFESLRVTHYSDVGPMTRHARL